MFDRTVGEAFAAHKDVDARDILIAQLAAAMNTMIQSCELPAKLESWDDVSAALMEYIAAAIPVVQETE